MSENESGAVIEAIRQLVSLIEDDSIDAEPKLTAALSAKQFEIERAWAGNLESSVIITRLQELTAALSAYDGGIVASDFGDAFALGKSTTSMGIRTLSIQKTQLLIGRQIDAARKRAG